MRSSVLLLAAMAAALGGCSSVGTRIALSTAQAMVEPYAFHLEGSAEGVLVANARWLVVDARVSVAAQFMGPRDLHGISEVLWSRRFERDAGQRAYEIVFSTDTTQKWVQIVPVSWERVRQAMPWLPTARPETVAPVDPPSERIPIERPAA